MPLTKVTYSMINGDIVNALDYGADLSGTDDSAPAIQAALDTGKSVFLPKGIYKLNSPVTLSTSGQRLFGENTTGTYLTGGVDHDQVRIAASYCEVDHILFRPSGYSDASPPAFVPLRVYSGLAHIHDNRFLSNADGHGTAILLDDVNPATSATVSGAYVHTIKNNKIGYQGYSFLFTIYSYCATNGQQATKFLENTIIGDIGILMYKGGGNYYSGNLFQSVTGTSGTPVGNAIDLKENVTSEVISGNYFERYTNGVIARRVTEDYIVASVFGNHYDNCTKAFYSVSSPLYIYTDERSLITFDYFQSSNMSYHVNQGALTYTANGQTKTPTYSWNQVSGGGTGRTSCYLGNGSYSGQHLYLLGFTWSVEILKGTNIQFNGSAASVTFGSSAGNIAMMHLMWDTGSSKWFEVSRSVV